ncbi:mediator of RNA polymerase II transcription subunit 19-like [Haliotis rubra]|uniref:mediator of RNA polymerase II transcription subunit 19-like n=1 Tax=Haliotis rubra TaxID=36100 RepID=UPI001EE53003|nr:mediator of RNA polymerase II transcription subunit 19-like [Haliotis rubra]XP_046556821.1 mediator of RNA polymerase II transcription subunit 19-like [Haliotis rubra]
MMADPLRRPDQVSPKSSPRDRGSRSPAYPRQDSTGTLKTTISLGKIPSVIHTGPFYLMKDVPEPAEITGSTNLLSQYGLEHSYSKFCGKKVKEELSAFLPHLPGNIDSPGMQDNSSLRSLIEKPPIIGKELSSLAGSALTGFRLHPGPLPEQYQLLNQMTQKRKHKRKKKHKEGEKGSALQETQTENAADAEAKKVKKPRKDEDNSKDNSKKKEKKKKKKKKRHSPEHQPSATQGSEGAS